MCVCVSQTYWATAILHDQPALDEGKLIRALIRILDMADDTPSDRGGSTLEHYHYPEPHEPHPVGDGPQKRKIDACFHLVAGKTKVASPYNEERFNIIVHATYVCIYVIVPYILLRAICMQHTYLTHVCKISTYP